MFEFETVQRSEGTAMPTPADFSSPVADDSNLLEKAADEYGAAAVEIIEAEPSDADSEIESLLAVPSKSPKP